MVASGPVCARRKRGGTGAHFAVGATTIIHRTFDAQAVADEIDSAAYEADVTDYDAFDNAIRDAAARMGGVTLLYRPELPQRLMAWLTKRDDLPLPADSNDRD